MTLPAVLRIFVGLVLILRLLPLDTATVSADAEQPGNPLIFGVAAHAWWLDPNVYGDQLFPALDDLGVTTVRLGVDWRRFEPTQGVYDWSLYDRVLGELARRNIVVVADFDTVPPWASTDVAGCADPEHEIHACDLRPDRYPDFERAVATVVSRYLWIDHWEFWNEPEMWTQLGDKAYLRNLRAFYDVAHRVNPDVVVAADTLNGPEFMEYLYNLSDLWYGKGHEPWDAIAYHPYNLDVVLEPDGHPMPIRFDRIQALHELTVARGGLHKKIWITEYGWNNTPQVQAPNLAETLDWLNRQPYIAFAHLHMLHDWNDQDTGAFGLMRIEPGPDGVRRLTPQTRFAPKPLYYDAFKNYPRAGLPLPPSQPGTLVFPETGHSLSGQFLRAWQARGGLRIVGYPLTRPYPRLQPDGTWLLVQDFERARLELHPGSGGSPPVVLAALIGTQMTAQRRTEATFLPVAAGTPTQARDWFPETGHTVAYGFRDFWLRHGGVAVFGYPISEELDERDQSTGRVLTTQYFERARFEWHPELRGTEYEVQLGLLVREDLGAARWLASRDPRLPTAREFQ